MRLNKNIFQPISFTENKQKFLNCTPNRLRRGDYVKIVFFIHDTKKKGGANSRVNKITGILLKKKIRFNNITLLVSVMYKNEKVKWRL